MVFRQSRETQITIAKWTNAGGQTKRANERSFVYRPPAWRRQTTTTTNVAWISSDCSESFSPLSNDVTEGVITTWSNRMKFRLQETFVYAGFLCWLSQVPSVVGPTSYVHSRDQRVWGKKVFWTWHEKMLLFSLMLRCSSDRTFPPVEKICALMGFGRVDKVGTADCFLWSLSLLVLPLLRLMKRVTGVTQ